MAIIRKPKVINNNQSGVGHLLLFLLIIIIIAAVSFVGWTVHKSAKKTAMTSTDQKMTQADHPLVLKSIGFNLDYYDPATNHAGDMEFTHEDHDLNSNFNLIFADFGTQDPRSPGDPTKTNVQPVFILPLGTKVHSLVDGVVADVKGLYSGDSTIWVTANGQMTSYIYETEHIINPIVKKGDKVSGGQVIGEVSTHSSQYHPGFGIVEIGILHSSGTQAQHICPFHYLDPSIKADIDKKILAVHKAWTDYVGMPNLYDDAHSVEPGCFVLGPVNG
ncbi:MAG TPA: M23 family metallopeptidase [Candidatus Saccharimonadales bacterium]|nr:M23 family metallopeptidase [Candidatus Saccharimonadales bacterium]